VTVTCPTWGATASAGGNIERLLADVPLSQFDQPLKVAARLV